MNQGNRDILIPLPPKPDGGKELNEFQLVPTPNIEFKNSGDAPNQIVSENKKRDPVIIVWGKINKFIRKTKFSDSVWRDPSLWILILSNLFAMGMIMANNVPLWSIVAIYWFQNIIIGLFTFIRILCLKDFSTEGVTTSDGKLVLATTGTKIHLGLVFLLTFLGFHLMYLMIPHDNIIWSRDMTHIVLILFANHLFSFVYSFCKQITNQNIGDIVLVTIVRVLPLHMTMLLILILGQVAIIPFLLLRFFLDICGHAFKHADFAHEEIDSED